LITNSRGTERSGLPQTAAPVVVGSAERINPGRSHHRVSIPQTYCSVIRSAERHVLARLCKSSRATRIAGRPCLITSIWNFRRVSAY